MLSPPCFPSLLWRGHPVTVRQLQAPGTQPDVLLADLQHCRYVTSGLSPGQPSPADQSPGAQSTRGFHKQKSRECSNSRGYSLHLWASAWHEPSY